MQTLALQTCETLLFLIKNFHFTIVTRQKGSICLWASMPNKTQRGDCSKESKGLFFGSGPPQRQRWANAQRAGFSQTSRVYRGRNYQSLWLRELGLWSLLIGWCWGRGWLTSASGVGISPGITWSGFPRFAGPGAETPLRPRYYLVWGKLCLCGQQTSGFIPEIIWCWPEHHCPEDVMIKGVVMEERGSSVSQSAGWGQC